MANVQLCINIKCRWWVKPYFWALHLITIPALPFLTPDQVDRWVEWNGDFILKHGMTTKVVARRVE